jgi:uncharacterized membrane protein
MNLSWAHVHLLLNHFPIIGTIAALIIFIVGWLRHSRPLKQVSYWTFFLMALLAISVYYSGTQAYATVESLPNVTAAHIHRHREVAEWSFIGLAIVGALSLMGMLIARRSKLAPGWFNVTFLVVAIAATGLVSWAGLHGGTIRHTEVRGELSALMLNLEAFAHEEGGSGHSHSETEDAFQSPDTDASEADEAIPTAPEPGDGHNHTH